MDGKGVRTHFYAQTFETAPYDVPPVEWIYPKDQAWRILQDAEHRLCKGEATANLSNQKGTLPDASKPRPCPNAGTCIHFQTSGQSGEDPNKNQVIP